MTVRTNLLVIIGAAGTGKSTLAYEFAKKHDYVLIEEDYFVFGMHPASMIKRIARQSDRKLGMENMLTVLSDHVKAGKNVLVSGAFVDGPVRLHELSEWAKATGYRFVPVMLAASEPTRRKREKTRGYVLPRLLDRQLAKKAERLKYAEQSHVLDTTNLSQAESLEQLESIVKQGAQHD
jgi:predicted kinase